jgi:hypothetical protein
MKSKIIICGGAFVCGLALGISGAGAATTISATNDYAYGANIGWMDGRGDTTNGAIIGEYVCSGYLYAANVGWIGLGNGAPADGVWYRNDSEGDYGVNHDGSGNLRGFAYGANIGWILFETNGAPKVNLSSGALSGHVWSANCGWISLSNSAAHLATDVIAPGTDRDGDGIPDAWEWTWFGNLTTASARSDYDQDGMLDRQEYLADSNPRNPSSNLRITTFQHGVSTPTYTILAWTSQPSRRYGIERRSALDPANAWQEFFTLPGPGIGAVGFDEFGGPFFYRIRAFRPLAP